MDIESERVQVHGRIELMMSAVPQIPACASSVVGRRLEKQQRDREASDGSLQWIP